MEDIDRAFVEALRVNARATHAQLGRGVGLSASSAHERVAKLEASGAITGYHAAVSPAAVGLPVTALVGILQADRSEPERIAAALRGMPEIEDCWLVAGEETFVVKVRVADVASLERTILALSRIRGVARTRSTVVLSTPVGGADPVGRSPRRVNRGRPRSRSVSGRGRPAHYRWPAHLDGASGECRDGGRGAGRTVATGDGRRPTA